MRLLEHTPTFFLTDASRLVNEHYGFAGVVEQLPSERDQNFLVTPRFGQRLVLKIANALEEERFIDAQDRVMRHLGARIDLCPQVIPTKQGKPFERIASPSGSSHCIRLVSYLPGTPMSALNAHSPELLRDLGRKIGQVDRALVGFDHPAVHRDFHWDLANATKIVGEYWSLIRDEAFQELVLKITASFKEEIIPQAESVRTSVIHNDANSDNVLVANNRVVGLIDFGDMVYSYTVGNLAVAVAYAILDKSDPLGTAATIVGGYHSKSPLQDNETAAIWGFIQMRLCMSASIAANQRSQRPDNEYLNVSQDAIGRTLPRLAEISYSEAMSAFHEACKAEPIAESYAG